MGNATVLNIHLTGYLMFTPEKDQYRSPVVQTSFFKRNWLRFPSQSCPRGKPDKSMMWLGVTVNGERRQLNLFLNVERYYYYDYYDVVIFPFR